MNITCIIICDLLNYILELFVKDRPMESGTVDLQSLSSKLLKLTKTELC